MLMNWPERKIDSDNLVIFLYLDSSISIRFVLFRFTFFPAFCGWLFDCFLIFKV